MMPACLSVVPSLAAYSERSQPGKSMSPAPPKRKVTVAAAQKSRSARRPVRSRTLESAGEHCAELIVFRLGNRRALPPYCAHYWQIAGTRVLAVLLPAA